MMRFPLLVFLVASAASDGQHPRSLHRSRGERAAVTEDKAYWMTLGQNLVKEELLKQRIDNAAKNVIFFLGDGMSISTVTAARIYKGQKQGKSGEEEQLSFDKFPFAALSRTYCVDAQVADSACSATAYLCGVKTDIDTLGLDANVEYKNCATQNNVDNRVDSVMVWAQAAGKGTGIVTTTRVTHATPAGTYAHVANRDWEDDAMIKGDGQDPNTCDDIAEQLVQNEPGKNFKVILGGGRSYFTPKQSLDPETNATGNRLDQKDLIKQWKDDHPKGAYVINQQELLSLNLNDVSSVLGLFSPSHMEYYLESANTNNPTLEEMTRTAISLLQKEANGYVLLVEGGRIDQGHHDGLAHIALEEAFQFDLAVQVALNMTNPSDTLIVVTADHSHTMTIGGYTDRGNNILGLVGYLADDDKPFTSLSYANGPGYSTAFVNGTRADLTNVNTNDTKFHQPAGVPINSETHGGDDVAIYAYGPQAHLFEGVYEQHYIAHVMGYAACIGPGIKFCDNPMTTGIPPATASSSRLTVYPVFPVVCLLLSRLVGLL